MPMNAKFKPPSVSRRGRQPQRITGISRPMDARLSVNQQVALAGRR